MRRTRHLFLFLFCMFGLLSSPWLVLAHPQIEELEANGEWLERESEHFRFHFLPDSAAERDIEPLLIEAEQSLGRILVRLEMDYEAQLDVYLVDRVFWQGGAAYGGQEVLFSYLDRNYANVPINQDRGINNFLIWAHLGGSQVTVTYKATQDEKLST